MALLILPRHFQSRAELYQQLSRLTSAGIGLPQAVEIQRRSPPARSFREPLAIVQNQLAAGATFADALRATGNWLPAFDAALLHAGEQSGRLPACFELLSQHYERAGVLLRKSISSLLYPALLFHMAVLIAPLQELVRTSNVLGYLARVLVVLLPVYAVVGFIVLALQGQHGERWRSWIESILQYVPLLGTARRKLALARLASALEALTAAGVNIVEAWTLSAAACGSPAIRKAVAGWTPQFETGSTPSELVRSSRVFPELFANLYHTGEMTGSLDQTLRRLHRLYQDEGEQQLQLVADWAPKLVYLGVALVVAWQVIQFWSGYFQQINQVIGG